MEFIGFFKEQYQKMFGPSDSWQVKYMSPSSSCNLVLQVAMAKRKGQAEAWSSVEQAVKQLDQVDKSSVQKLLQQWMPVTDEVAVLVLVDTCNDHVRQNMGKLWSLLEDSGGTHILTGRSFESACFPQLSQWKISINNCNLLVQSSS